MTRYAVNTGSLGRKSIENLRSGVSKVLNYLNGFTSAYLAIFPSLFFDKFVVDLYQIKEKGVFFFVYRI